MKQYKYSDVLGIQTHLYAPELNVLVFKNFDEFPCPQIVEPRKAYDYYVKKSQTRHK